MCYHLCKFQIQSKMASLFMASWFFSLPIQSTVSWDRHRAPWIEALNTFRSRAMQRYHLAKSKRTQWSNNLSFWNCNVHIFSHQVSFLLVLSLHCMHSLLLFQKPFGDVMQWIPTSGFVKFCSSGSERSVFLVNWRMSSGDRVKVFCKASKVLQIPLW